MSDLIGQTLLNRYRIDAFVASGGMGAVYRVWDLKRNVSLAMKVLREPWPENSEEYDRFQHEAKALETLRHPNIVPFYGFFRAPKFKFLLQGFVDGVTLKDILRDRRGTAMSPQQSIKYVKALCAALGYAHANGIVHCDVKPGNVLVARSGEIFLTDFGLARYIGSLPTIREGAGTPAYMAPEQIEGEPPSPQTDIYALGIMLFEMLTGKKPFRGEHAGSKGTINERIRWEHLYCTPPSLSSEYSNYSLELEEIVLRCLEKNPLLRYPSMSALMDDLVKYVASLPDEAERIGVGYQTTLETTDFGEQLEFQGRVGENQHRSQSWIWLMMVGAAVMLIVIIVAIGFTSSQYDLSLTSNAKDFSTIPPAQVVASTPPSKTNIPILIQPVTQEVDACMIILIDGDPNNYIEECVTQVSVLPDGIMKVDFSWTAYIESRNEVVIEPDTQKNHMFLLDNLGNRYDHFKTGDGAEQVVILRNGESSFGWFLFPDLIPEAEFFSFHDTDNNVQTASISIRKKEP